MSLYQKTSLVQIPSGYKAADAKLYSVVPNTTAGDFTVDSDADATRVNKDGLIETTVANQARLNYDFIDGVVQPDPHLLLEPTRTNECLYSKTLSSWTELNGGTLQTITNNDAIAPDGSLTASTITFTDTGTSLLRQFSNKAYTSNKHSSSFYAKKISGNGSVFFGITDTETEFTPTDEWVRYEVNNVTPTNFLTNLFLDLNFDCSAGDKIAVWGMQLEEGTYSTSLIPTSGSAVTRTEDTCKLENFNNMPTNYPFTVFCDMDFIEDDKGYGFSIIDISSSSNYFSVGYSEDGGTLGKFRFTNRAQGTGYNFNTLSTYGTGRYKIAVKFISATNFKGFINGVEVADYTHPSSPFNTNINDVLLGQLRVAGDTGDRNPIHQFMIFNEALTDQELITLTT